MLIFCALHYSTMVVYTFACYNENQECQFPTHWFTLRTITKQLLEILVPDYYDWILFVAVKRSQVHTSRIIAFMSRERGRLQKSYLHDSSGINMLKNYSTTKIIRAWNNKTKNRKGNSTVYEIVWRMPKQSKQQFPKHVI